MNTTTYDDRLTTVEKEALDSASDALGYYGNETRSQGVIRFLFYRRKGYNHADAFEYAMAWSRNAVEQKGRRLAHDTGAENWR